MHTHGGCEAILDRQTGIRMIIDIIKKKFLDKTGLWPLSSTQIRQTKEKVAHT